MIYIYVLLSVVSSYIAQYHRNFVWTRILVKPAPILFLLWSTNTVVTPINERKRADYGEQPSKESQADQKPFSIISLFSSY